MRLKYWNQGTALSIGTSPDTKWISN
jgi:hypothetical protein